MGLADCFSAKIAIEHGVDIAILYNHLIFQNQRKAYFSSTIEEIAASMPYYSNSRVKELMKEAEKLGMFTCERPDTDAIDPKIRYTFHV